MKMPQFTLTASQTDALTTALLALTARSRSMPDSLRVAAIPETNYQPAGHAGKLITELACFSCHRINGRGGDMAPDLTWEGSSVQRQWLTDFLHNPNTLRPSLIRRMPRFNLSDSDNKELTDYILTVYQSPAIDADFAPPTDHSGCRGARAPIVLFEICLPGVPHRRHQDRQGIHRTDADAGWLAPDSGLDLRVAEKSAGTAPRHRQNRTRIMSDEDARALTAFLMSLKGPGGRGAKMMMTRFDCIQLHASCLCSGGASLARHAGRLQAFSLQQMQD